MLRIIARILLALMVIMGLTQDTALAQRGRFGVITRFAEALVSGVAVDMVSASLLSGEEESVEEAEPAEEAENPAYEDRAITGYTFRVRWRMPEGTYVGTVSMWEAHGTFSVNTPDGLTIDQDMEAVRLEDDAEAIWLLASNPRFAPGSEERENYFYGPDHLRMTNVPDVGWTIPHTCFYETENSVKCSSVEVLDAREH